MKKIESLMEIQEIELEILSNIAAVCEQHQWRYFLAGGTLLGALRHKGFIPWDNDIDISMPRRDYEKLLQFYKKNGSRYKILQVGENTNYYLPFAKVVDTETLLVEKSIETHVPELGLFVDIFPIDGVGDDYESARKNVLKMSKSGFRIATAAKKLSGQSFYDKMRILFWKILTSIRGRETEFKRINKKLMNYDFDKSKYIASTYGVRGEKEIIDATAFSDYVYLTFENKKYRAPVGYDQYLKQMYGDYMKLPPKEHQTANHDIDVYWRNIN